MAIQDLSGDGLRALLVWQFEDAKERRAAEDAERKAEEQRNDERARQYQKELAERDRKRAAFRARVEIFEEELDALCKKHDVELLSDGGHGELEVVNGYSAPCLHPH